jgi:RNA polymerase sigma-70 factor (family 1)
MMKFTNQDEQSEMTTGGYVYAEEAFFESCLLHQDRQFTGIVHAHSTRLFYLAYQITKNRQVAEDIVQEAFLKLWQHRTKIIPGNHGGWLRKVVSNLGYKHIRRASVQFKIFNSLQSENKNYYSDVEERLIKKENDELFNNIFNRLPRKQQIVYHLSREKGLRRNEIASQLNLSPNTVKVHLSRALQFMKEHITFIIIFLLFFVFNNLIFCDSNTSSGSRDLYKIKYRIDKDLLDKTIKLGLPDYPGSGKNMPQAIVFNTMR